MDLRPPQESSLTMPIPMNYGSIHESSKFRMLSGPHSHGGSGLNGPLHTSPVPIRAPLPSPPPPPAPPPNTEEPSHTRLTSTSMAPAATAGSASASVAASEQGNMPSLSPMPPALPLMSLAPKKPVKYRDCLKNHAANIGGHALDGCGEFMPSGEEGSLEALKCAACGCHRNFHRREVEGELISSGCGFCYSPRSGTIKDRRRFTPLAALPPHTPLALPPSPHPAGGAGAAPPRNISQQGALPLHMSLHSPPDGDDDSHPQELHMPPHHHSLMGAAMHYNHFGHSASMKKRFRTKFSSEQKDKMFAFAEKLGWRIQKHDESVVHQFCADVGVKRHVFKVWMHNNKNTFGKRTSPNEGGVAYLENGVSSPVTSSGNMQA